MKLNNLIKAIIYTAFLMPPFAAVGEEPTFHVDMRIVENGVELATPRMLVKEGSEASISLAGENSVAIGLIVNRQSENEAYVLAEVKTPESQISPELLIQTGEWASVSVGELEFHILVEDHAAEK
jgi:hypothetical protein